MGDPGRVNILTALLDGRALTATELAFTAGIAPATASEHLAKLATNSGTFCAADPVCANAFRPRRAAFVICADQPS